MILILLNIKSIIRYINNNLRIFLFIFFTLVYLILISNLSNPLVAIDILRLIINIIAIWFIVFKTKEDYLYFSVGLCVLVVFFYICYLLQSFWMDSLYVWNDNPVNELTGVRFLGSWGRVTLSDGPKSGSILYLGIFMYFLFAKYHHTNRNNKNLIRCGLIFSFLLLLFTQTISGYIVFLITMIHFTLIHLKWRGNSISSFLVFIVIPLVTIAIVSIAYMFTLGSIRVILHGLYYDLLKMITKSLIIGKGYGYTLYSGDISFLTFNSDYSFYMVLIYEIGFISIIILSIIFILLNKNYYILYYYLAIVSTAMHTTSQLIYSCFIIILASQMIEIKRMYNYRWST